MLKNFKAIAAVDRSLLQTICIVCLLTGSGLLNGQVMAADDKGRFAIRGAGLLTCDIFLFEKNQKSQLYFMTASWIDGYVSATNQRSDDTYDIMAFETTELLAAVIGEHCLKNPSHTMFAVINDLTEKLHANRLIEKSEKIELKVAERKASLYTITLVKMQAKLKEMGFFSGQLNAKYNEETIEALKKFQLSIKYEATGFPDQMTVWRLMREND